MLGPCYSDLLLAASRRQVGRTRQLGQRLSTVTVQGRWSAGRLPVEIPGGHFWFQGVSEPLFAHRHQGNLCPENLPSLLPTLTFLQPMGQPVPAGPSCALATLKAPHHLPPLEEASREPHLCLGSPHPSCSLEPSCPPCCSQEPTPRQPSLDSTSLLLGEAPPPALLT